MHSRHSLSIGLIGAVFGLCLSCSSTFSPYIPIDPIDTLKAESGPGYQKSAAFTQTYAEVSETSPFRYLDSTGTQKILVIPVEFSDHPSSRLKGGRTGSLRHLETAFFGAADDNYYESVASYYNRSSYGHLSLVGKVSTWFDCGLSVNDLRNVEGYAIKTQYMLKRAVEWYKSQYDDIEDFDQNQDGCVDAVWLIYSAPFDLEDDLLWAHTFFDNDKRGYLSAPYGGAYSWASYNFLFYATRKPETHILIHETGHLFGLKDYYSTDPDDINAPCGKLDMMDANIGDHNAFSKMLLGWTTPYYVTSATTLTITSFPASGDCIILTPSWNGSAMDEYLVLEYYTPTYLAEMDAERGYGQYREFTTPGLKVYHVDARLGYIRNIENTFLGYVDETDPNTLLPHYTALAHSNTITTSPNETELIRLLEQDGNDRFSDGASATNDTLWQTNDYFNTSNFRDFAFHSHEESPLSFTVTAMDDDTITISFQNWH